MDFLFSFACETISGMFTVVKFFSSAICPVSGTPKFCRDQELSSLLVNVLVTLKSVDKMIVVWAFKFFSNVSCKKLCVVDLEMWHSKFYSIKIVQDIVWKKV